MIHNIAMDIVFLLVVKKIIDISERDRYVIIIEKILKALVIIVVLIIICIIIITIKKG